MAPDAAGKTHGILVVGEMAGEAMSPLAMELLGLARRLIGEGTAPAAVLVLGQPAASVTAGLIASGADRVYVAATGNDQLYQSDVWLEAMRGTLASFAPSLILMGHTSLGADLAPRLAFQLNAALAMGCERVAMSGGQLLATRPCFGNKAREVVSLRAEPAIATVRSRTNEPLESDPGRRGEVLSVALGALAPAIPRITSRTREELGQGPSLEKAKIVIAGGRGLGGPEGFAELAKLAESVGGVVGASRVACDLGWCPHSWQIGLTGKTVTPRLYIAVGISGASHHMAGCGNSGAILAINSDPDAAIFKEARFGVVGDYKQIVPALVSEFAQLKSRQPAASHQA